MLQLNVGHKTFNSKIISIVISKPKTEIRKIVQHDNEIFLSVYEFVLKTIGRNGKRPYKILKTFSTVL